MKAFSESEDKRMDAMLKLRSLESRAHKRRRRPILPRQRLLKPVSISIQKLNATGVVLRMNEPGGFLFLPKADPSRQKSHRPPQILGPSAG